MGLGGGGGITVFSVNLADGSLTEVSRTGPELTDISSDGMCISDDGRFLYTVIETASLGGKRGTGGGVAAFAISRQDGSLTHLNTVPSMGSDPVGVIIDKTNARVLVANHGDVTAVATVIKQNGAPVVDARADDATVALYPVRPDGSLEPACDVAVFPPRQPGDPGKNPAAHQVIFDRSQKWAIASDNGGDHLYVYPFNPKTRTLVGKAFPTPPGKAPRHFALHPRAPYVFITNEQEASVSAFHFDSSTGEVSPLQTVSTLQAGYAGPAVSPSDIRIHPNGAFLYAANRGDDSLAIFAVDQTTGRLTLGDVVKTGGRNPREMGFEPTGRYLYVCNIQSGDVTTFAVDGATGGLTRGPQMKLERPAVIHFAAL
jgi:6-phosphogluconolactonase